LIAQGLSDGRQHKKGCHCEEERRGNLPYFLNASLVTPFFYLPIKTDQVFPKFSWKSQKEGVILHIIGRWHFSTWTVIL